MREFRYAPYRREFDEDAAVWVLVGRDVDGEDFGVGSGQTLEEAEEELRVWILDSLLADAAAGEDRRGDLVRERPDGPAIAFTVADLLPVVLRLARVRHGLTQEQLAQLLGVTQQAYAKLERIGANPQVRTLQQVERAVGEDLLIAVG
jgi:DNA-binding XRE family transcriptional regulator